MAGNSKTCEGSGMIKYTQTPATAILIDSTADVCLFIIICLILQTCKYVTITYLNLMQREPSTLSVRENMQALTGCQNLTED